MARHLPSTLSLTAFEAAARHGSFSAAAEELALSQSTVSYRVRQLEDLLGMALFRRLTRRIELTAAGRELLPVVRETLERLGAGIGRLRAEHSPGLRVRLSTYFAARWLSPRLADWAADPDAPEIVFDHGEPRVEPRGEPGGAPDLAIRWGKAGRVGAGWPGGRARLLIPTEMTPHCSPALARSLTRPADILFQTLLAESPGYDMWPDWLAAVGLEPLPGQRRVVLADSNVRIQAAADGLGVVLADHLAAPEVASGKLVVPFDLSVGGAGYFVLTKAAPPESVARFVRWLAAQA